MVMEVGYKYREKCCMVTIIEERESLLMIKVETNFEGRL